ncbi:bifunctional diaminohydroxyphosphoribosylaminopyrimidine deaminase/5-amino-6-(5-phosphoribosylamino)uracil reductase RibD [Lutimaribacter sp. EGI FJ00014]|uniref:Bifunctional diaminohydroxyphosphoribosylaminopyrimidine deaminase/5-amino-6-(5-phosphoribosylamino)uracil reductase RibD n=2 Tax=Lutimaribacter degradans TaxID=2945989 RepID=A0ACC5ZRI6_9RHOB|nr:bifunctional diaminohydroxyphosphoribosylaminopyrimidine deaminase/5-amino-6-(5-phosphoribosylamino)uracil reductase RibD [Lutimaribacter sp. EGI FJ00013]MCM2560788.1 bifunctional diaminohydroxyphosphoribosylaminopyrimidine deaminase/5-amino-6-(5-phosphoribosylamino)uracil reductase RibD [Lutimaribacter sp. EGI FJ00013]MCO0634613.1 bifunctional diaminohydroxyphosphoribosylaminopyrimidine deaminase/5-amino-6-(5-phosphoribosylamino)uracil reductase RibD [Lutimaribacter sp. EGI FJ00014]
MALALSLGRRGQGNAWPNPAVGCVVVRDGRIVGRGWTAPGGRPHAEPQALAQAGRLAQGATAYVTLEPCAHHGQTPPCTDALIDAGVARVVVALEDNDPRVAGKGLALLRAAGIDVNTGVLAERAAQDLAGFRLVRGQGRPWLTLKLANSFDGRIATATGESQWITGPQARRAVHAMRMTHDAVMVGAGTARADDPSLTVRDIGAARQPVRVVVSRRLDLPLSSKLARTAREVPVWLCHGPDPDGPLADAWDGIGAKRLPCAVIGGQLDPGSVLSELATAGLTRVFCEGGGALAASLLAAGLVDELVGFSAGVVIGAEGRPAVGVMGVARLAEAPRFKLVETRALGGDVLHRWWRTPA